MARARQYASNAERQAAYRARKAAAQAAKEARVSGEFVRPGQGLVARVTAEDARLRARDEAGSA
jgi:hypothetical protein